MPRKIDPSLIGSGVVNSGGGYTGMSVTINQYNQPQDSYPASSISVTNETNIFLGDNVESNLTELAGLIIERPPVLGEGFKTYSYESLTETHSGLPDWGVYKVADTYIWDRLDPWQIRVAGLTTTQAIVGMEDNYENSLPAPASDVASDPVYNISEVDGGGAGGIYRGNLILTDGEIIKAHTMRNETKFTISGMVYPADRGVLALVQWGLNTNLSPASSVSDIENRVLGAIKLGYGIEEDGENNDGEPGLLFVEGSGSNFPSRTAGQYDLVELHTGIKRVGEGSELISIPANNRAGQVRLLTDPTACFFGEDAPTVTENGIPILGGDSNAIGGSSPLNFFGFRLPQLKSYLPEDIYTPVEERARFFTAYTPNSLDSDELDSAGGYLTLGKNLFGNQVARFRHTHSNFSGGSLALIHFKTEHAFEKFARDGIVPSEDDVWSVSLNSYSDPSQDLTDTSSPYNEKGLVTGAEPSAVTAPGNALVRLNLVEENQPGTALTLTEVPASNTYTTELDYSVMWVSGVPYLTKESSLVLPITMLESAGSPYILSEDSGRVVYYDDNFISPVQLYLSGLGNNFTITGFLDGNPHTFTSDIVGLSGDLLTNSGATFGRINLSLNIGVNGSVGDIPSLISVSTFIDGVLNVPYFHAITKPPMLANDFASVRTTGGTLSTLLFFSGGQEGEYGNARTDEEGVLIVELPVGAGDGGLPTMVKSDRFTARKDTQERFLDETYRIRSNFDGFSFTHHGQDVGNDNLVGPGLPLGSYFYNTFVMRDTTGSNHFTAGWISNKYHLSLPIGECVVKGIANQAISRTYSYGDKPLRRGVLSRATSNYTTTTSNLLVGNDSATWTPVSPNYAVISYNQVDTSYVRAFDLAFSRSEVTEDVAGSTQFTLRVVGLRYSDFLTTTNRARIQVKVPGLTAWLNIGRPNGSGGSKQSSTLDGAGCCVSYTEGYLKSEGVVYTDVLCDIGSNAVLTANDQGEVLVLVKVVLELGYLSTYSDFSGTMYHNRRGLIGLEVLRASTGKNYDNEDVILL